MAKRNTFILNAALTLTIAVSVYYAMNDTTQSTYTGVTRARAFEGRSQRSGEPSASFAIGQLAGITKAVTRYADGQLLSNCIKGNYSIVNRNCTGSDGNGYISLQAASDASAAGDTILIRSFSGVYTGSAGYSGIVPKSGTSPSVRTTYSGYLTERPRVGPIGNGSTPASYVYIKNLIVDMQNTFDSYMGGISYSRLENLEIKNGGVHGILGIGSSELINLDVHDNGSNNSLCIPATPNYQCHGVYTGPGSASDPLGNFNTFDGGRYYNNGAGYGIHCYSHCAGTTIRNLRVDHNGWTGVIMLSDSGNQIYNVVADNNGGLGIWITSDGMVASNITAYNNSAGEIYVSDSNNQTVKNTIAIPSGITAVPGTILSNNITSGSASSYFVDAANGNFQLLPTSPAGIGASLPMVYN